MALSCIVCEIQRVTGRKSQKFYVPPVFSAPAAGDKINFHKTSCGEEIVTMR